MQFHRLFFCCKAADCKTLYTNNMKDKGRQRHATKHATSTYTNAIVAIVSFVAFLCDKESFYDLVRNSRKEPNLRR